ncbi:MAG: DUF4332 domain-containing protein [Bdellovibrionales bacterium]|nr:DUF4332 domain-containing protein [Bdellovibrionales bacterium]
MGYPIQSIRGIRSTFIKKLQSANIKTTDDLLSFCSSRTSRTKVAAQTGISASYLLLLTQKAELLKFDGISQEYYKLLSEAGVETLEDLSQTHPRKLSDEIKVINNKKNITKLPPKEFLLEDWIDKAKQFQSQIEL